MRHSTFAGNTLLLLFGLLLIFHLLVILGKIPSDIVWAGKINNRKELIKMETLSILILCLAAIIVALKMKYLIFFKNEVLIKIGSWFLVAFFALNTLGNLSAKMPIEKYGFGLLTILMTLLAWSLAVSK